MALLRGLFEWVQCFVRCIPRRRKKHGVQKGTEAEWTPMEGPLDVSNTDQTRYCKASKYLNDEEKREVRKKRKLKKKGKMVDERESGRKEEETKDPTPLRIEVKPQPTPPAAEIKTSAGSSFIKSSVKEPLVAKRAPRLLPPLTTKTRPPSSGEQPVLAQKVSRQPAIKVKPLPASSFMKSSVEEPALSLANTAPKATLCGSSAVDPEVVQKASRQPARPATETLAVRHEPTPKQVVSSSTSSKSPEEEPRMVQRASRFLLPAAIKNVPLQTVAKPSMLRMTSRHFAPKPTGSKPLRGSFLLEPKRASRRLTPPAEEPVAKPLFVFVKHTPTESLSHSMDGRLMEQVRLPSEQIPKCATSSLLLMDAESEEDESAEHTERTVPSSKSQTDEVKQKRKFEKVHPIVLQESNDSEKKKCGDSKAEALRKAKELDERMMRLFCVDYSNAPKKESQQRLKLKNQQVPEAEVKQKAVFEKVHPIVLEQSDDSEKKECGDSKAEALRKAKELDERMMRLFCVDYSPCPEKEKQRPSRKGQEKPKKKGKKRAGPFSWAEKKLKRINEEKEESDKDEKYSS